MSAQLKAGPYMELCKAESKKITQSVIQEINKGLTDSDWSLYKTFCRLGDARDAFVYEYNLKTKYKHIKNIESIERAYMLKNKQRLTKDVCNEEGLSHYIKFFDIEFLYKYNSKKEIVSLRFNINDCGTNTLARKNFDRTKESNEHLKKMQKDANDAMQIYN